MDIKKEKWKPVKSLRSQSKYAILMYDKIAVKDNFRKQRCLFLFAIILENLYSKGNISPLQDLGISTEGHFEKQILILLIFKKF